jgi:hypothetical protein
VTAARGARFRRAIVFVRRGRGVAVFQLALRVVVVALLLRGRIPRDEESSQVPARWRDWQHFGRLGFIRLRPDKVEPEGVRQKTPNIGACRQSHLEGRF